MDFKQTVIASALALSVMLAASAPAAAQSSIYVPRGPVISSNDPLFMGLVIGPGTNSCRRLNTRDFGWRCTYGRLPPGPAATGLGGDSLDDQPATKPAQAMKRRKPSAQAGTLKSGKKFSKRSFRYRKAS